MEISKKAANIFTFWSNQFAKVWLITSHAIKLMQWDMHQIFSILEYFSVIISFAFLTFAALSDTIAEIQLGSTFLIISSIFSAKYLAVCEFKNRSES